MAGDKGACGNIAGYAMEKIIIAAVADNMAIGRDNALLWHITADMKYFRKTTMGCPVIMGYRTWLSIGRSLPGRKNIVITKYPLNVPETVVQVTDEEAAIAEAAMSAPAPERCFIIGGAKTYGRTMTIADALYITHVRTSVPDADAFFPPIDPAVWLKESETDPETDPESGLRYSFAIYRRR